MVFAKTPHFFYVVFQNHVNYAVFYVVYLRGFLRGFHSAKEHDFDFLLGARSAPVFWRIGVQISPQGMTYQVTAPPDIKPRPPTHTFRRSSRGGGDRGRGVGGSGGFGGSGDSGDSGAGRCKIRCSEGLSQLGAVVALSLT